MTAIIWKTRAISQVMWRYALRLRFSEQLTRLNTTRHNPVFFYKLATAVKTALTKGTAGSTDAESRPPPASFDQTPGPMHSKCY